MKPEKTGKLIAGRRQILGMTQRELAERLAVSPKTVSKWECGKGFPDVGILLALSEVLQVSILELITGEEGTEAVSEHSDVQEMRAWEQYARREKRKIRCLYIVLAVLTAVCLLGFLLALDGNWNAAAFICGIGCVLAGGGLCFKLADPRIRDWKKQSPVSAQAVVLEKKIRISGGGSAAGYPCIVVRMVGDQKKILDTLSWEVYDSLFPGDQIRIRYQGFVLLEYRMLYQGPVAKAASRRREAEGQFIKRYIKTVARWRHFPVAEFRLAGGEKLILRVSEEWESPKAEDTGTLRWHGEILDDFEILES